MISQLLEGSGQSVDENQSSEVLTTTNSTTAEENEEKEEQQNTVILQKPQETHIIAENIPKGLNLYIY